MVMRAAKMTLWTGATVMLSSCTLNGCSISGRVLEVGTEIPVVDAIVVVTWDGSISAIVDSKTVCVHVESTKTDAEGRYKVPGWFKRSSVGWVTNVGPIVDVYKAGYEQPKFGQENVHLERSTSSPQQRLADLQRKSFAIRRCSSPEANGRELIPLFRAFHDEARVLARTGQDEKIVNGLWLEIQNVETQYAEQAKNESERELFR